MNIRHHQRLPSSETLKSRGGSVNPWIRGSVDPWIIRGSSVDHPWIIRGSSVDHPWIIRGSSVDPWIRGSVAPWLRADPWICKSVCLSVCGSVCLSVCGSVCLSVCGSVCLSVCPSSFLITSSLPAVVHPSRVCFWPGSLSASSLARILGTFAGSRATSSSSSSMMPCRRWRRLDLRKLF